jgi:hypothetical protein
MMNPSCLLLLVGLVTVSLLTACHPQRMSASCKGKLSACLAHCQPAERGTAGPGERAVLFNVDQRTQCEKNCHDLCTGSPIPGPSGTQPVPDPDSVLGQEVHR